MTTVPAGRTAPLAEPWGLAARETIASWREMLDRKSAARNVAAGVSTALVAIPLNVALALACGLPPATGLITGAVAGVLSALLGGSRLQVTGPEVALAPLTLAIVTTHGVAGLFAATFLAGLIQIALGLLRVGRFVRAIPAPVVGGFMAAVGLLVLNSQLPRLLGLRDVRLMSDLRDVSALATISLPSAAIGAAAIASLLILPRIHKRIPAPLIAMGLGVIAVLVGARTATLDPIDHVAPTIAFPAFGKVSLATLIPDAIALAALASLDSLLCAIGMDARTRGPRVRTDQELVAQGVANMASACVGGMPVAAAIVRSVAAHDAGADSRLAPLVQSIALAVVLVALAPFLPLVPIAALSAILLVVGCRLIDWKGLARAYAASRAEALLFVATVVAILATDFVTGVGIGLLLALLDFARKNARLSVQAATPADGDGEVAAVKVVRLEGALFFGSHTRVEQVIAEADGARAVVVDLSGVRDADLTGATSLAQVVDRLAARGGEVWISGAEGALAKLLHAAELGERLVAGAEEAALRLADEARPSRRAAAETTNEITKERRSSRRLSLTSRLQPSLE